MSNRLVFALLSLSVLLSAKSREEFVHPDLLSFEQGQTVLQPSDGSSLSLSDEHFKHGRNALRWDWSKPGASIVLRRNIPWGPDPKDAPDPSTYTFVYWLYSLQPLPGGTLRVEFLKQGRRCSWFDYGLDFKGWRGAWIAFERDMQGRPEPDMDEMRMTVIGLPCGTLFMDHLIPSSLQDLRQHTGDTQAPYINPNRDNHWLQGLNSTTTRFDLPIASTLAPTDRQQIELIEQRVIDFAIGERKISKLDQLRQSFERFAIVANPDGSLRGNPLFFVRYGETYFSLGHPRNTKLFAESAMQIEECSDLLMQLAITYRKTQEPNDRSEIKQLFLLMTRYMLDQGFSHGSAMGTLHHMGYSMKNFYYPFLLMKDELYAAGLGEEVRRSMEWFSMAGEVKVKPTVPGLDIDILNTGLLPRLTAILMLPQTPEKKSYLDSYTRWLNNGFLPAPGLAPTLKTDGTVFHHRNSYPAYARDGMRGAIEAVYLLAGTSFAISPEGHEQLKKSLMTMRFYCNLLHWPLSMSGRHPTGTQGLSPQQYAMFALAGTPDGKAAVDREMAAAYMRLSVGGEKKNRFCDQVETLDIQAEPSPTGNLSLPYACAMIHRRDDWAVSVRGFSRYLWNAETYERANLFGRYLAFGNLQIVGGGNPISNEGSGYRQEGWDWNHWWGITSVIRPIEQLKSTVLNVDTFSGNEEMLLSDEAFAGGVSLEGRNGAFAMKLHDHDKYDGTLRARKSYFFFDHRIVCLGSGIESGEPFYPTATTLFQEFVPLRRTAIGIDGRQVDEFPFEWTQKGNARLADAQGNHYFVRNAEVKLSRRRNQSFHQNSALPAEGDFTIASISHGKAPKDATYEYAILVKPSADEAEQWGKWQRSNRLPYSVLRHDNSAHIVSDKTSSSTAYVLFESGTTNVKADILSASLPCLAMTRKVGAREMRLSVADPDLRFYEGAADEKYDANGKRIERSIYSRTWIDNPSKPSEVQITLCGRWTLAAPSPHCQVVATSNKETVLLFSCCEGASREVVLAR